jgi:DNA-binding TFAR19-related protein (PDSD5 family)
VEENELEEIRKQKQLEKQKELEAKETEKKLKEALRSALSEEAYERLNNISYVNKELYLTAAQQILYAYKNMGRTISDKELLTVLRAIKERTEKDVSITFKKK